MNTKKFTKWDIARIKRTAQNVDQFITKKNKLVAQIDNLKEQLAIIQKQIDLTDAPTVNLTGYGSEDLVKKVITPTDKVTKDGTVIKTVKYELRYPDTVIPPTEVETESTETAETAESVEENTGE